jgi:hypothetical protein
MDKETVEYIECSCGSETLRMSYDTSDDWTGLNIAFWMYGHPYSFRLKDRLRWMWHVLRKGKPYDDMVILDTLKSAQVIEFIQKYLKWANSKIDSIIDSLPQ